MGELAGRVALVTGGSRGVGLAIAVSLAKAGAGVAVLARTRDEVSSATATVSETGRQAIGVVADVSDEQAVGSAVGEIEHALGPVDILVNAAARATVIGPTWQVNPEEWWREIEVNLRGPYLCARAVLPQMISRRSGTIVNLVSNLGLRPSPFVAAYASSKAALLRFTDSLADEVGDYEIQVFAISPGFVRTSLSEPMLASPYRNSWLSPMPPGSDDSQRFTSPDLAGKLVVRLASGQAKALSGRFIHVSADVKVLIEQAAEIRRRDLRALRLSH